MDVSGSITDENWEREKQVAKQIAGLHDFGADGIQAGVVTFDDDASLGIKLSAHSTKSAFETALDQLADTKGGTDILAGLEAAITKMFNSTNGMRADSKKVAVLLTDGQDSAQDTEYEKMAERFQQKDIRLKVVGVGEVSEDHLKLLVSQDNDYVYASDVRQFLKEGEGFEVEDICRL